MDLKSYMKKNIFDITLLCFTRNKWNQFDPGPKYFASREQSIEIYHPLYTRTACWKWQHFTRFIFENKAKVESLLILVVLKRQNVDYYEHRCIFYSVTQEKVQFQHFMGNNKTKKKANYQQFLSQRQFSVYYSLVLKKNKKVKKNNRFSIYGGKSEQRQNVCIFIFRIKTLQAAVRRECYVSQFVSLCALFSPLYGSHVAFSVSHCWDKRHLCRLGIVGAFWDCSQSQIYL